jgi:hypothetical protein
MSNIESNLDYMESNDPEYKNSKNAKLLISNEIWNIAPIMSTIFNYSNSRELIEFSTVCKKWSLLTAPIIYKSIKLLTDKSAKQRARGWGLTNGDIEAEVEDCITNNSKYSRYVKELKFSENVNPKIAIEVFETFKYLTILHITNVEISQDQFLCMIKPLDKLEELELNRVGINKTSKDRLYKKSIQLPKTLTKLYLIELKLTGNTGLFDNSINSHSNLKQFELEYSDEGNFLTPFYECYPSLKQFSYSCNTEANQSLARVIKSNPQITSLKLESCPLVSLIEPISKYLINLQEFEFSNPTFNDRDFEYSFSQPIKIKKLKVTSTLDSSALWNSLLKLCPDIEEFNYCPSSNYMGRNLSLTVERPTKIKRLKIHCKELNKFTMDSILLNCPYLKELDIIFPKKWKRCFDTVAKRCIGLEKLTLYSNCSLNNQEEYSSLKFLSKANFKNTLTSLTLNGVNFCCSANSSYLRNYSNLKYIKFQIVTRARGKWGSIIPLNKDVWPGYLKTCYLNRDYDGYRLTKIYKN